MELLIGFFRNHRDSQTKLFGMKIMRLRHAVRFAALMLLLNINTATAAETISEVGAIGITVSDMRRSLDFYTQILSFKLVTDKKVAGDAYEHLTGVFGLRMRIVQLQLGDERINLIEYLAPRGRPIPVDSHSNDRWFQHIAIIVSDMDKAYAHLRTHNVAQVSPEPQRYRTGTPRLAVSRPFISTTPMAITLRYCNFLMARAHRNGIKKMTGYSLALTIRPSSSPILRPVCTFIGICSGFA